MKRKLDMNEEIKEEGLEIKKVKVNNEIKEIEIESENYNIKLKIGLFGFEGNVLNCNGNLIREIDFEIEEDYM
jgi:hypothetical protein